MPPSMEVSQRTTEPVFPVSVSVPAFEPAQTVVDPEIVPPAVGGSIPIARTDDVAGAHGPFWTTARYIVGTVKLLNACAVVVFETVVHVPPPSMDVSHRRTLPVCPKRVRTPEFPE